MISSSDRGVAVVITVPDPEAVDPGTAGGGVLVSTVSVSAAVDI